MVRCTGAPSLSVRARGWHAQKRLPRVLAAAGEQEASPSWTGRAFGWALKGPLRWLGVSGNSKPARATCTVPPVSRASGCRELALKRARVAQNHMHAADPELKGVARVGADKSLRSTNTSALEHCNWSATAERPIWSFASASAPFQIGLYSASKACRIYIGFAVAWNC